MDGLRFDFSGALARIVGEHGFRESEISAEENRMKEARESLLLRPPGFRNVIRSRGGVLEDIEKTADYIRSRFRNLVVLGIGGSALGPITVHQALGSDSPVKLTVADNIDPDTMDKILRLDPEATAYNVISKSGQTSETMAQFMAVAGMLRAKKLPLKEHIIATTDGEKGSLLEIARREGIKTFHIPQDLGGRFSELSPVGLLPAAACGIGIRKILEGALYFDEICMDESNPAMIYALLHVLGMKKGMNISVMMPYSDRLKYFSDWYAQLWAESLGKRNAKDGREIYCGQTPVKALGVTDQHSQVQLYAEGPFDKIITFIRVEGFGADPQIPREFGYVDDLAFLGGKTFKELLLSELSATRYALIKAGRPNIMITLDSITEFTVGALLYFFEMATAYAGEMLGINAYDQPGVEEGKRATFALMGKKGYEEKREQMREAEKTVPGFVMEYRL